MPQPNASPAALVTRTILWIVIASIFLVTNVLKVQRSYATGQSPTPWVWLQLALWSVALIFWLYTGWRDWTRRPG